MNLNLTEFLVLAIIAKGKVYSSDILVQLNELDLLMVEGTLYPLLSRLKRKDIVKYFWRESKSGPPRKYYSLTAEGRSHFNQLKEQWDQVKTSIETIIKDTKE